MEAEIIQLAEIRARRSEPGHAFTGVSGAEAFNDRFHFWSGASGRRYVHTIYSLFECPPVSAGNYILVRREADGRRTVLGVGSVADQAASLNLATIRQQGAIAGANEVHVHLLAESGRQLAVIESDLRSAHVENRGEAEIARIYH